MGGEKIEGWVLIVGVEGRDMGVGWVRFDGEGGGGVWRGVVEQKD
jgi:hypothetical protein